MAAAASSASVAQEADADGLNREADALIARVWETHLLRCGSSSFELLDGRVLLELDQPQFHLAPTRLQKPAKENGYEYQTTAIASAARWRWAPVGKGGSIDWRPWQEGQTMTVRYDQTGGERGYTTVPDAVLQFDLVRRNGQWTANHPLSPLNSDFRQFDPASASLPADMPPCDRLVGKGA